MQQLQKILEVAKIQKNAEKNCKKAKAIAEVSNSWNIS